MTPERIRETLIWVKHAKFEEPPEDFKIVRDFWYDTGCLAKDLIASSNDELNELWARFVFNRIAEAKEV